MLSSLLVTRQIDPRSHNNKRTEFRLDTRVFMANPRLIDVSSAVTSNGTPQYPWNTGTNALIKNVLVYSGNSLIGDCREWSKYAGWKLSLKDNQQQLGVLPKLARSRQGTINKWEVGVNSKVGYGLVRQRLRLAAAAKNLVTDAAAYRGYIRLADFVEFFNATPYLSYIPNLRIIIEWADPKVSNTLYVPSGDAVTAYTIGRPTLVIDEIVDEQTLSGFKPEMNVQYLNVEYAKQDIAAVTSGSQRNALRPKTFDGKYLKDLLLQIQPTTDANLDNAAKLGSGLVKNTARALFEEKWRLYVNGAGILQQDGIDSPARKMLFSKISRGAIARNLFHYQFLADDDEYQLDWELANQSGRQAYLTVGVEDLINHLDIDLRRSFQTAADDNINAAANVHVFGRVARTFVLQNNKVLTAY